VLLAEHHHKWQEVIALRNPRGLWRALIVLAYFSVVWIVLPMIVMANHPAPDGTTSLRWVIAAFVSGLLALGSHIVLSVRELRPVHDVSDADGKGR